MNGESQPGVAWKIRAGTVADVPAALALWLEAGGRPSHTDDEGSVAALLARDAGALLVAEADGALAGALIAAWDGWRGNFYRLAVGPAWRRRGLATALVRVGEQRLVGLGAVRLTAIVAEEVPGSAEFWAAAGYERQAATARFVRNE